jgi:hypothetical protein
VVKLSPQQQCGETIFQTYSEVKIMRGASSRSAGAGHRPSARPSSTPLLSNTRDRADAKSCSTTMKTIDNFGTRMVFAGVVTNVTTQIGFACGNAVNSYHSTYTDYYNQGCHDALTTGNYNNPRSETRFGASNNFIGFCQGLIGGAAGAGFCAGGGWFLGRSIHHFRQGTWTSVKHGLQNIVVGAGMIFGGAAINYFNSTADWGASPNSVDARWPGYETGFGVCCQQVPGHTCPDNPSLSFDTRDETNSGILTRPSTQAKKDFAAVAALVLVGTGLFKGVASSFEDGCKRVPVCCRRAPEASDADAAERGAAASRVSYARFDDDRAMPEGGSGSAVRSAAPGGAVRVSPPTAATARP